MKFKEYLKELNVLAQKHPESLNKDIVYSMDEEGNEFRPIFYGPSIGNFNGIDFEVSKNNINAICLN